MLQEEAQQALLKEFVIFLSKWLPRDAPGVWLPGGQPFEEAQAALLKELMIFLSKLCTGAGLEGWSIQEEAQAPLLKEFDIFLSKWLRRDAPGVNCAPE